jgi:hypothetical protein
MNSIWLALKGKKTYIVSAIIIVYSIASRGFGANDWAGAAGMMSTALVGACLRNSLPKSGASK